jgi:hypothetical protein
MHRVLTVAIHGPNPPTSKDLQAYVPADWPADLKLSMTPPAWGKDISVTADVPSCRGGYAFEWGNGEAELDCCEVANTPSALQS